MNNRCIDTCNLKVRTENTKDKNIRVIDCIRFGYFRSKHLLANLTTSNVHALPCSGLTEDTCIQYSCSFFFIFVNNNAPSNYGRHSLYKGVSRGLFSGSACRCFFLVMPRRSIHDSFRFTMQFFLGWDTSLIREFPTLAITKVHRVTLDIGDSNHGGS